MKYPPITHALLKKKKACQKQLDLFEKHIGLNKPIPLTKKTIDKFTHIFDIDWAARNLLDSDDFAEFDKVTAPASAEYDKAFDAAWAEYEKVRLAAWAEYDKVCDSALAEFNKVQATEFVRIYKRGLTA